MKQIYLGPYNHIFFRGGGGREIFVDILLNLKKKGQFCSSFNPYPYIHPVENIVLNNCSVHILALRKESKWREIHAAPLVVYFITATVQFIV